MIHDFHMSPAEALRMPLLEAFALSAYHQTSNPWCAVEFDTDGYVSQERWRRAEARDRK